jgi:hypothetical protein
MGGKIHPAVERFFYGISKQMFGFFDELRFGSSNSQGRVVQVPLYQVSKSVIRSRLLPARVISLNVSGRWVLNVHLQMPGWFIRLRGKFCFSDWS